MQSLLRITGTLGLAQPRDVIIQLLCKHALPYQFSVEVEPPKEGWQVAKKHLQVCSIVH